MFSPSSFASSQSWRDDLRHAEVRATRGEGHRHELVVRGEVLATDAPNVVGIGRDGAAEPPGRDRRVRKAVGEDRPDAAVLEPLDGGVRVLGRVHDVRPIHERRDAGVDRLERTPLVRRVDVVGPVLGRELVEDGAEVGAQRVVGRAGPDRRLPGMAVRVDEAGDDDVAGRVDDLRVRCGQVRADLGDDVPHHEDVRTRQLAKRIVLGQDDRVLDEDPVGHGSLLRRISVRRRCWPPIGRRSVAQCARVGHPQVSALTSLPARAPPAARPASGRAAHPRPSRNPVPRVRRWRLRGRARDSCPPAASARARTQRTRG